MYLGNWQILFIRNSGGSKNLYNYRPITLLPTIYKLRGDVMSNRITPTLNILTKGQQCAYVYTRSTMGIIYVTVMYGNMYGTVF